ncbi:LOW QUALITY PROTEIN: testis-specific gene 10 protein [Sylvia borin]
MPAPVPVRSFEPAASGAPSASRGVVSDPEVLQILRECEELESTWKINEHAEIQGNFQVLTAERDILNLYEQAQEEISQLCQEVIKCPRTPKSTVTAQAVLRHMEIERDTVLSDFQRLPAECDSLREQLKISQETAFNEKAYLEQRIEELETTIHNLESEQLEQMSKVARMKDTIDSLETEIKRLTNKVLDSETELSQEAEYASLCLLNEKTELRLSGIQSLVKKKFEMHLSQEKIMHLDEKTGNFSRSLVQQEEICTLKETIAQLNVEKSSLQDCVEEGGERIEKIATFQESLAIKVLCKKLAKYQTERDDMNLKAQDSNRDTFRLKYVLSLKENCELLENYHKACEQGEGWEAKCHFKIFVYLQSKCESNHSETELLRKQLGNEKASMKNLESLLVSNCENKFQSQRAKQEKDSEIQFLKEQQVDLVENNLRNQDFTHLRNRAAQLESELDITRTQLGTERFDRKVYFCIVLPAANWGKLQRDYKIMDGAKGTFVNGDDIQTSSDF